MGRIIGGFLDNDSVFGRIMTRCGIIIGANLMFILFSLPILTLGPSLVALYHVMLKVLRGDGVLNPFKEFWNGFRNNFRQAMIYSAAVVLLSLLGVIDVRFCRQQGGALQWFCYAIYVIGIVLSVITAYLLPVMAAFADTIPHLIRNAVFFAARNPVKILLMLFLDVFPLYLTYTDIQRQPMYVFVWAMFGFGAIAMMGSSLLVKDFSRFLPKPEEYEKMPVQNKKKTKIQILHEMKKLDV